MTLRVILAHQNLQNPSSSQIVYKYIPENSFTLTEWAEKLGFGIKKTRTLLGNLIREGKALSYTVEIIDIANRKNRTVRYKINERE